MTLFTAGIFEVGILSLVLLAIGIAATVTAIWSDLITVPEGAGNIQTMLLGRGNRVFVGVAFLMVGLALALDLSWMQWTWPTALFFIGLFSLLLVMTAWDILSPTGHPKGFLPIPFSRGERLFLSFMIFFGTLVLWGAFLPEVSLWFGLGLAAVLIAVVAKFG